MRMWWQDGLSCRGCSAAIKDRFSPTAPVPVARSSNVSGSGCGKSMGRGRGTPKGARKGSGRGTPGRVTPGRGTSGRGTPGRGTPGRGTPGGGASGRGASGRGTPGRGLSGRAAGRGTPGRGRGRGEASQGGRAGVMPRSTIKASLEMPWDAPSPDNSAGDYDDDKDEDFVVGLTTGLYDRCNDHTAWQGPKTKVPPPSLPPGRVHVRVGQVCRGMQYLVSVIVHALIEALKACTWP